MAKFTCPVCNKEIKINLRKNKKPIGGLYEVIIQHEDHFIKVYIDENDVVRRAFPIEHFIRADTPLYTIYIYEDRAEIIDKNGNAYITDPTPLIDVVKKIT